MWRVVFTLAMAAVALSATVRYEPQLFPHRSSEPLAAACLVLAAYLTTLYLQTLTSESLTRRHALRMAALPCVAAVGILTSWEFLPHVSRGGEGQTLTSIPMSMALLVYMTCSNVPLVMTLTKVALYCWGQCGRSLGRNTIGLALIGIFSLIGALCFLVTLAHFAMRLPQRKAELNNLWVFLPARVNAVCLLGLSLGAVLLWLIPAWDRRTQHRRERVDVRLLWAHLTRRHPGVRLVTTGETSYLRQLIEIHDALRLESVDLSQDEPVERLVSRAVLGECVPPGAHRVSALTALASLSHNGSDKDIAIGLSAEFRKHLSGRDKDALNTFGLSQ